MRLLLDHHSRLSTALTPKYLYARPLYKNAALRSPPYRRPTHIFTMRQETIFNIVRGVQFFFALSRSSLILFN